MFARLEKIATLPMRALGDVRRKAPLEPAKAETPQPVQETPVEESDESFEESVEIL